MTSCTFRAAFPPIQSAIKTSGNGDGMRIQLDIPESEMASAVELLTMRQCVLKVTVEPEKQVITGEQGKIQKGTKRKSKREAAEE